MVQLVEQCPGYRKVASSIPGQGTPGLYDWQVAMVHIPGWGKINLFKIGKSTVFGDLLSSSSGGPCKAVISVLVT